MTSEIHPQLVPRWNFKLDIGTFFTPADILTMLQILKADYIGMY